MNNFQGKTPQQYSNSAKIAWYGVVGMIVLLILVTLFSGCTTTKKTDKCCQTEKTSAE